MCARGIGSLSNIAGAEDQVELTLVATGKRIPPAPGRVDEASWAASGYPTSTYYNTWDHNNVAGLGSRRTLPTSSSNGSRCTAWRMRHHHDIHDIVTADEEFQCDGMWKNRSFYRIDGPSTRFPTTMVNNPWLQQGQFERAV